MNSQENDPFEPSQQDAGQDQAEKEQLTRSMGAPDFATKRERLVRSMHEPGFPAKREQLTRSVSEPRLSIRLTPVEMARVEYWMEWLQSTFPKHAKVGQKTLFLEALDALEWRTRERARMSGKPLAQVTITYSLQADGVVLEQVDNPQQAELPRGISQAATISSLEELVLLFVRTGWQQVVSRNDAVLLFDKY